MELNEHNASEYRTVDGFPFQLAGTGLTDGKPYAIIVNGTVARLDYALQCAENHGYSLVRNERAHTRFFNVYRAADGGFVMGKRAFVTNAERAETRDSDRAIAALKITLSENSVTAERV